MTNILKNMSSHVTSSPMDEHPIWFLNLAKGLGIISTFAVAVVGTLGNVLSIVVLWKTMQRTRKCSLFTILIGLACSDSGVLIMNVLVNVVGQAYEFLHWNAFISIYLNSGNVVRYGWPITLAVQMISIYLTVLVSYERFMVVCYPLKSSQGTSYRKLVLCMFVIVILSLLYNVPRFFEIETKTVPLTSDNFAHKVTEQTLTELQCVLPPTSGNNDNSTTQASAEYTEIAHGLPTCNLFRVIFNKTDLGRNVYFRVTYNSLLYSIFMFLLPVVAISYMNFRLVSTIRKNKKSWISVSRKQKREVQLTYVPLTIVAMFYMFSLPAVIINIVDSIYDGGITTFPWQAIMLISNFLVLLNCATNFIIYSLLGARFRATLRQMFCSCFVDIDNSLSTSTTNHINLQRSHQNPFLKDKYVFTASVRETKIFHKVGANNYHANENLITSEDALSNQPALLGNNLFKQPTLSLNSKKFHCVEVHDKT